MQLDPQLCRLPPAPEQIQGSNAIIRAAEEKDGFALFDDPGAGKSKQVIDAACVLYKAGIIDTVLVLCPAQVKVGWVDQEFGEIQKHTFINCIVREIRQKRYQIPVSKDRLVWAVVSFEWMRDNVELLEQELRGRKTLFVADESIKISRYTAKTTKRAVRLRDEFALAAVVLNGTPGDMLRVYCQYRFASKKIFSKFQNFFHYRYHFAVVHKQFKGKVLQWLNKEEFDALTVPYTLRRPKPDTVPPKTYSVLSCNLSPATWKIYKQMRDDMIAWLQTSREDVLEPSVAKQAITKGLRLAQITSGFLGGVEDYENNAFVTREIGSEKTDALIEWIEQQRESYDGNFRLLVWCRFRPEAQRLVSVLEKADAKVVQIVGGQAKTNRREAVREFMLGDGPCVLVGNPAAGGLGLNLLRADGEVFLSNSYNVFDRAQAEDRAHRRERVTPCPIWDMLAYGPDGQKTIDHSVLKSLRDGFDLHTWTASAWRKALEE